MAALINRLERRQMRVEIGRVRIQLPQAPQMPGPPITLVADFDVRDHLGAASGRPDRYAKPVVPLIGLHTVTVHPPAALRELNPIEQDERIGVQSDVEETRPGKK